MLVPVILYDVLVGARGDDPDARIVATCPRAECATALARELARRQGRGEVLPGAEYFVRPRDADLEFATSTAGERAGYTLRLVLAPTIAEREAAAAEELQRELEGAPDVALGGGAV